MGVTYKFKQEIVDFIVQKKKDDAGISCRRLVDIVCQQFDVEVSKSSVNAVLKEFQLSSPVGRRAVCKPPKNFAIPRDRKELLLKNVAPFLTAGPAEPLEPVVVSEPLPPLPEIPPLRKSVEPESVDGPVVAAAVDVDPTPVFVEEPLLLENRGLDLERPCLEDHHVEAPPIVLPEPVSVDTESTASLVMAVTPESPAEGEEGLSIGLKLQPDFLAKPDVHAPELRIELEKAAMASPVQGGAVWGEDRGMCYSGMGLWMLVALLAYAQRVPHLGEVLAEKLGLPAEKTVWQKLEAVVLAEMFLVESQATEASEKELILSTLFQVTMREREDWLARLSSPEAESGIMVAARSALCSAGVRVNAIRLASSAGKCVYLAADQQGCSDDVSTLARCGVPLFYAVESCADRLVTGAWPVVLRELPWGASEPKTQEFLRGFEEGVWQRAELVGMEHQVLAGFDLVKGLRHEWIVGVRLSEAEYARLDADMISASPVYMDPLSGKEYSCFDGRLLVEGAARRIIVVSYLGAREVVIMTNSVKPAEDVFAQYLDVLDQDVLHKNGLNGPETTNIVGLDANTHDKNTYCAPQQEIGVNLFSGLSENILRLFCLDLPFVDRSLLVELCRVPGFFKKKPGKTLIRFFPAPSCGVLAALEQSVFLLNRSNLRDYDGNRLCFSIEKK